MGKQGRVTQEDREAVRVAARDHSFDRYLCALLAPREVRDDLIALAAFVGEIERVPLAVSDPTLGEIRLRWWLDQLEGIGDGGRSGHPVADMFLDVVQRRALPVDNVRGLIEARGLELYAQPFASTSEYMGFLSRTEAAAARMAAELAGSEEDSEAAARFGLAYGAVRQLLRLPHLVLRGRWALVPGEDGEVEAAEISDENERRRADAVRRDAIGLTRQILGEARAAGGSLSRAGRIAALPAALVEPYLAALESQDDWLQTDADISPIGRVWRLWLAKARARI